MKNLEIKVVTSNIEEIKNKAIKINAEYKGVLQQVDTYFLVGKKRLKLRKELNRNYLVFYVRENTDDSKFSKYYIINISKYLSLLVKKLLSFILGVKVIVNKKRELFIYKNTRIHLDQVENLGVYVELETVFNDNKKESELVEEHNFIVFSLGLDKLEKISNSYSDLLIKKN